MTITIEDLLRTPPVVANVGARSFAEALEQQGAKVVHVEWAPPPELDADVAELLEELG